MASLQEFEKKIQSNITHLNQNQDLEIEKMIALHQESKDLINQGNAMLQKFHASLSAESGKASKADRVLNLQQKIEIIRNNFQKIKSDSLSLEEKISLYHSTQSLIHHVNQELNKKTEMITL